MAGGDRSVLDEVLREGAERMLMTAIEAHKADVDQAGRRRVVRNGRARARTVVTPVGPITVRAPRVEDRRRNEQGRKFRFSSKIVAP